MVVVCVLGANSEVFYRSLLHLNGSLDCHDSIAQVNPSAPLTPSLYLLISSHLTIHKLSAIYIQSWNATLTIISLMMM